MGKVFTKLTQIVTGTKLTDFTCGFKGFTAEAGKKVFNLSVIDRWSYDAEIVFLANKHGYKIKEEPVEWSNREDSRVSLGSAVVTSFLDLIKIRLNDLNGKYSQKA